MTGGSTADTDGRFGASGVAERHTRVVVDVEATGGRRQGRHGGKPPPFHLALKKKNEAKAFVRCASVVRRSLSSNPETLLCLFVSDLSDPASRQIKSCRASVKSREMHMHGLQDCTSCDNSGGRSTSTRRSYVQSAIAA